VTESVLKALKRGPKSRREIKEELGVEDSHLDKILRELVREGKIRASSRRWVLTSSKTCHTCGGSGWI